MSAVAAFPASVIDLDAIADGLMAEHRLVPSALPALVARVAEDRTLLDQVMARVTEATCRKVLEDAMARRITSERRARPGPPPNGAAARAVDLERHGAAVEEGLMAYLVRPGLKLAGATREDLNRASAALQTVGQDALVKSKWLQLIAQGMPAGATVADRFSEARLAELRAEARRDVGGAS